MEGAWERGAEKNTSVYTLQGLSDFNDIRIF
jgi:hypothetical protein